MSTDGALDGYFDALEHFREATRVRDYPLAAQHLRLGLRELQSRALNEFVATWGVPPSIPFIQGPGLAIAALYPDAETDRLLNLLAEHPALNGRLSPDDAVETARIVRDLRALVAASPGLDRKELRARLAPVDGRLTGSLLDYLVKGKLIYDRAGTYSAHPPLPRPGEATTPGFRPGMSPVPPPMIDLLRLPMAVGIERTLEQWDVPTPALPATVETDAPGDAVISIDSGTREVRWPLETIPTADRRAGKATTIVLDHYTWLIRYTRPAAATEHQYTAEIRDRQNHTIRRFDLPHPPKRTTAFPDRGHLVILDTAGDLYAYRGDGEVLAQHNLGASPELQQALADSIENTLVDQQRPGTVVSAVDWNPATGRVLYAATGKIWCADSDGRMLWSHELPPAPSWPARWNRDAIPDEVRNAAVSLGLRPDPTPRELVAVLALAGVTGETPPPRSQRALLTLWHAVGSWNTEWIGAAFFTASGATVCCSSGLNLDLDQRGTPTRIWVSRYGFTPLAFTAGGVAGTLRGQLVTVAHDARDSALNHANPVAEHHANVPGAVALGETLAYTSSDRLSIMSLDGRLQRSYRLPRGLTALVPTDTGLVAEIGARRTLLSG